MIVCKRIALIACVLWAIVSCSEAPSAQADPAKPKPIPGQERHEHGEPQEFLLA